MYRHFVEIIRGSLFPPRAAWIFALRTNAAAFIALVLAFALNLDQPQWAMLTVFIVSQPIAGMVITKGIFRLGGTIVGALAAIALTAATAHSQWAFVAVIALWVALCTYAASMLRNPESYGAALAGYTAVIIALPAFGEPHLLMEFAVARCAEIMLGIICAGIAGRFFLPQLARAALVDGVEKCIADLAQYTSSAIAGCDPEQLKGAHRKLIADTQALSAMRAHARLEAPGLVTHGRHSRHTVGRLMACLSIVNILIVHRSTADNRWTELRSRVGETLDAMSKGYKTVAPEIWLGRLKDFSDQIRDLKNGKWTDDAIGMMARLTLLGEFLDNLAAVLRGVIALRSRSQNAAPDAKVPSLLVYRDSSGAMVNAVRAAIATAFMSAYWMATKHADAAAAAVIVAVVCSLFASMPNPLQTSWDFFKGTLYAVPFAFVLSQLILPHFPGLAWFVIFVIPVLVPATLFMANPRYVSIATAFAIDFIVFLKPRDIMVFEPGEFLQSAIGILGGILIGIVIFIVVLPKRPKVVVNRMMNALRTDILRLCLRDRMPSSSGFESLAYDRVNQMMPTMRSMKGAGERLIDDALSSITLGLEIVRLRKLLQEGQLGEDLSNRILQNLLELARMITLGRADERSIAGYAFATRSLASGIPNISTLPEALQSAASLRLIAVVIEDHPSLISNADVV